MRQAANCRQCEREVKGHEHIYTMENKQNVKKSSKKNGIVTEKVLLKGNGPKKKKKNRKCAKSSDAKDSDPSPDNLEIEGLCVLDNMQGIESDSSHNCQENIAQPQPPLKEEKATESEPTTMMESSATVDNSRPSTDLQLSVSSIAIKPSQTSVDSESLSSVSLSKQKSVIPKGNKLKQNTSSFKSGYQFGAKFPKRNDESNKVKIMNVSSTTQLSKNESLRWDNPAENSEEEDERIRIYKMNRRKRYLAAAQAKGLGWVANYRQNGSPMSEDSGIDIKDRIPTKCEGHTLSDFGPMKNLAHGSSNAGLAMVEC